MEIILQKLGSKDLKIIKKTKILLKKFNITLSNSFALAECIKPSFCSNFLYTGHNDGSIHQWTLKNSLKSKIVASHTLAILSISLSEFFLVSSGQDRKLKVWKIESFSLIFEFDCEAVCIEFLSTPFDCLAGDNEGNLFRINLLKPNKVSYVKSFFESGINCLLFLQEQVFLGLESGVGVILKLGTMTQQGSLVHSAPINCACKHEDKIITASMDKHIRVWSVFTHELIFALQTDISIFLNLHIYKGYLLVTPMSRFLRLIRIDSFEHEVDFNLYEPLKCSTLVGDYLFYSGNHKNLRAFDLALREKSFVLTGHKGIVACLVVDPSSSLIATGGRDNTIRVWNLEVCQQIHILYGHTSLVRFLCFTPNNLLSVSDDKTLKIWDFHQEVILNSLPLPNILSKIPQNLAFNSPYISVICADFSYQLWSTEKLQVPIKITRKYRLMLYFRTKLRIK